MLGLAAAYLKEREFVELPQGITVEEMLSRLVKNGERRDLSLLKAATFFVNQEPAGRDTVLHDGDEVIIILHMAGG